MALDDFDDAFAQAGEGSMHSHDRTLLGKLGFSDPDKKSPDHDQACLFLTQPQTIEKIVGWLRQTIPGGAIDGKKVTEFKGKGRAEYHLQKGDGQYATTICFIDVLIRFTIEVEWEATLTEVYVRSGGYGGGYTKPCPPYQKTMTTAYTWDAFAEVKIGPAGIGDILRQLNLYRTYFVNHGHPPAGLPQGILVAPWDLSEAESRSLADAGYGFMKLGQSFRDWVAASTKKTDSFEL